MNIIPDYLKVVSGQIRRENIEDQKRLIQLYQNEWLNIRDFSHQSQSAIKEWQFKKIKFIVNYAYKHVPLYRKKYSSVFFEPGDLKTWNDFFKLPILEKQDLIDGFPDEIVSDEHNFERTTRSSGSSGTFVTLAVSPEAIYLDTIQGIRQFYFQSGNNYHENDSALFIYTCPWWVSSTGGKYPLYYLSTKVSIKEAVKKLNEVKPKILSLYPTYLRKLYDCKVDLNKYGVKYIITHSESSSLSERKALSEYFGIPVLDEFSSEELTRISLECPYHRYHLEEDACFSEVVDPFTKKPLNNGEQGLLVGTNLLNTATPIIRYHQGDLVSIENNKHHKCQCNSNFRVMNPVFGRHMDSFIGHNNEIIPAGSLMDIAYNWFLEKNIPVHGLKYQIVQYADKNVKVYLVTQTYKLTQKYLLQIKQSLASYLPKNISVEVIYNQGIPFLNDKKYRPIISFVKK